MTTPPPEPRCQDVFTNQFNCVNTTVRTLFDNSRPMLSLTRSNLVFSVQDLIDALPENGKKCTSTIAAVGTTRTAQRQQQVAFLNTNASLFVDVDTTSMPPCRIFYQCGKNNNPVPGTTKCVRYLYTDMTTDIINLYTQLSRRQQQRITDTLDLNRQGAGLISMDHINFSRNPYDVISVGDHYTLCWTQTANEITRNAHFKHLIPTLYDQYKHPTEDIYIDTIQFTWKYLPKNNNGSANLAGFDVEQTLADLLTHKDATDVFDLCLEHVMLQKLTKTTPSQSPGPPFTVSAQTIDVDMLDAEMDGGARRKKKKQRAQRAGEQTLSYKYSSIINDAITLAMKSSESLNTNTAAEILIRIVDRNEGRNLNVQDILHDLVNSENAIVAYARFIPLNLSESPHDSSSAVILVKLSTVQAQKSLSTGTRSSDVTVIRLTDELSQAGGAKRSSRRTSKKMSVNTRSCTSLRNGPTTTVSPCQNKCSTQQPRKQH